MKFPGLDPIQLPFARPAPVCGRPVSFALPIPIEPLLPEHSEERRQEGGGQSRIEDALSLDDNWIVARPSRYGGCGIGREGTGSGVEEHLEQPVVHFLVIRLEIRLHIEDKC